MFRSRRDDVDLETENRPYIDSLLQESDGGNPIRLFMNDPDQPETRQPCADLVEDFCAGPSLAAAEVGEGQAGGAQRLVALVDEKSFEGGIVRSRRYLGPLTAEGLYHVLIEPVRCPSSALFPLS